MRAFFTFAVVTALASPAIAGVDAQVKLPVGWSSTVTMPSRVTKVEVATADVVEVAFDGKTISLKGLAVGLADLTVVTPYGKSTVRVVIRPDVPEPAAETPAFWLLPS